MLKLLFLLSEYLRLLCWSRIHCVTALARP
jgi:hypothetical protein